jgi:uncharacterized membrane protein
LFKLFELPIPFFSKKELFTEAEKKQIVEAIQAAEHQTSGQVRVFVESRCRYVHPLDRAVEVFAGLKMDKTAARNAVLVYVAIKDRQLALFGDQGIHEKVGDAFWNEKVRLILSHFNKANYAQGLAHVVTEIGEVLSKYYPYDKNADQNELPDDIVFGK